MKQPSIWVLNVPIPEFPWRSLRRNGLPYIKIGGCVRYDRRAGLDLFLENHTIGRRFRCSVNVRRWSWINPGPPDISCPPTR